MDRMISAPIYTAGMFVGMLACIEAGRRLGVRRLAKDTDGAMIGLGPVEGAVFTLYGLLLAFTVSGAPSRLETQKQLLADEANAIGTAYLRLDLLPAKTQPELRKLFREYVDTRLETYRKLPDLDAAMSELAKSTGIQNEIWTKAVAGTSSAGSHPFSSVLLLPALNEMIDITTTRTMASRLHPPLVIFGLLLIMAFACSLLAGFDMAVSKRRSWLHIFSFTAVTVIAVGVFLDIEYPRAGYFRMDAYDQVLIDVRASMK